MRAEINLHHGDCLSAMREMPDNAYSIALVDPPYGIGMDAQIGKKKGERGSKWIGGKWDSEVPSPEYFDQLLRVSKNQIIWGGNYFNLKPSRCFLIWDKVQRIEQADCELAWTSMCGSARIFTYARGNLQGFRNPNRFHPTEKPVALYKWLLTNYAKEGDRILDTHGGSMSIALACWDLKFDLDLWELDADYYKAGVERFKKHQAQGQLF